ncbi:MAG: glycoside hydrolase family 2 TIM barrel-domain containing protein [Maribacter sp.]
MKKLYTLLLLSLVSITGFCQENSEINLFQNTDEREKTSLNGLWDIIVDPLENGYYSHRLEPKPDGYFLNKQMEKPSDLVEYNFDTSDQLMVPGDWNTQKDKLYYYEGTIWYKKDFKYVKDKQENLYLYFGAVNYKAIVYLNGELIGKHEGGYTPFQFNITDKVKDGNNFVVVKVDNRRERENVPTVNQDWWNYGGITRSVYLVKTPKSFISDYSVQLSSNNKNEISGWVRVKNSTEGDKVILEIPELSKKVEIKINNGLGKFNFKSKPQLWSPTNPKLYKISLTTKAETLTDEIGFRTITTNGSNIILNGEKIFLKGISIHEEAPFKTGRITTLEEDKTLLGWAKELGCNFIRLAHYPHNEQMVREAEKMGLMVWSEIPVYWTVAFDNKNTYKNAENQLSEMISRDKNRAAVILWSVANETPEGEDRLLFLDNLIKRARSLDPTRLITAALDTQAEGNDGKHIEDALGNLVDVIGINNYCGWYYGTPESCANVNWSSKFNKPMIMSEVGAGALYGLHGASNERWTEEYQAKVYENNIEMMKNIDFLAGVSPWILMDFRSSRRPLKRIQEDFNRKGLISEQGMRKKAFYTLQNYYINENKD